MQAPTAFCKIHCNGVKLAKKDGLFGKSDPFVVIKNQQGVPFAFSDVVKDNLNPFWKPIEIDVEAAGGMGANVTVCVSDYDSDGKHDLIGSFKIALRDLILNTKREHQLIDGRGFVCLFLFYLCYSTFLTIDHISRKKTGKFVVGKADQEQKPRPLAYEITFAAEGLPRMDGLTGKSDPFLQVYAHPQRVGRSFI